MIKSVVTLINNFTRRWNPSVTAIVDGRSTSNLQDMLEMQYNQQRQTRIAQQAFKVQVAQMGKTQAELFTLKRNWLHQTTKMTVEEYAEALQNLEDKLEQQRYLSSYLQTSQKQINWSSLIIFPMILIIYLNQMYFIKFYPFISLIHHINRLKNLCHQFLLNPCIEKTNT